MIIPALERVVDVEQIPHPRRYVRNIDSDLRVGLRRSDFLQDGVLVVQTHDARAERVQIYIYVGS